MSEPAWTIQSILAKMKPFLTERGFVAARLEAEVLLAHILQEPRMYLYTHFDRPLTPQELAAYREVLQRRLHGEPAAYITGEKEFMSLGFSVSPQVLIPRPETETLAEEALRFLEEQAGTRVCDIGTGSGAIAVSLAYHAGRPLQLTALDISPEALEVARANAARYDITLDLRVSDLFSAVSADEVFDLITANLPYVSTDEYATLPPGVRDYEPAAALLGGVDGMDIYRRLLAAAPEYLAADGIILLEISPPQAELVAEAAGPGYGYQVLPDLSGRWRVVKLWRAADVALKA